MPPLLATLARLKKQRRILARRAGRYNIKTLRSRELRITLSIQHAREAEVEVRRQIVEIIKNRKSQSDDQNYLIDIDGIQYDADSTEQLIGLPSKHEYAWYVVVNHQLTDLFASDFKFTVMPQYHLRFREFDWDGKIDLVNYCISDFCVAKSTFKRNVDDLEICQHRIVLIIESKSSASSYSDFSSKSRAAWRQVRQQAGYMFSSRKEQEQVGVMITIGESWTFAIIDRKHGIYPSEPSHAFYPCDLSSSSSEESAKQKVRSYRASPTDRSRRRTESVDMPSDFYNFGTIRSDNRLRMIRRKLLKLALDIDPPRS